MKNITELITKINTNLPSGINVKLDGTYPKAFFMKMKNYLLVDTDGNLTIKGSGLKGRTLEKYLREFQIQIFYRLLGISDIDITLSLYHYTAKINNHQLTVADIKKTVTLKVSYQEYQRLAKAKSRNRAAGYELATENNKVGDQISYYVTGEGKATPVFEHCRLASEFADDYNTDYYLKKLTALHKRYAEWL